MTAKTRLVVLVAIAVALAALVARNVVVRWKSGGGVSVEVAGPALSPPAPDSPPALAPRPMVRSGFEAPTSVPIVERVEKIAVVARVSSQQPVPLDGLRVEADIVADDVVLAPLGVGTTDAKGEARVGPVAVPRILRSLVAAPPLRTGFLYDPFTFEKPTGHAVLRVRALGRPELRIHEATVNVTDLATPKSPEWGPTIVDATDGVRTVTVPLTATTEPTIRGRVLDRTGQPLEGAYVRELDADRYAPDRRTDADGQFVVHIEKGGKVRLGVTFPWFDGQPAPVLSQEIDVAPGPAVTTVDLVVDSLVTIEGRVENAAGARVAGVPLALVTSGESVRSAQAWMWASSYWIAPPYCVRTRSAADGTFRFAGLPTDRKFEIRWWDDEDDERGGPKELAAGAKSVVVTVTARHGVCVRCVDAETGAPVKARVHIEPLDLRFSEEEASLSDPGEDGARGKPGKRLRVVATADRYDTVLRDVVVRRDEGLEEIVLRLTPARSRALVVVTAVDEDGHAWPACPALRWTVADSAADVDPRATAGAPAAFQTRDLAPGRYVVRTASNAVGLPASTTLRFATPAEATIEVPASGDVAVALALRRGGALRVTVVGKDGAAKEPGDMTSLSARDAEGRSTVLRLFGSKGRGDEWSEGSTGTRHETQALAPGIYTVEWTGGVHHDAPALVTAVVRVLPGQVVDVEIVDPR